MIEIITIKGEKWSFDEDTKRLYRGNTLVPEVEAEPVYSYLDKSLPPEFCGIYVKSINSIISMSGNINKITNADSID
jgi:hypothetical protein